MSAEQAGEPHVILNEDAAKKAYGEAVTEFYREVGIAGRKHGIPAWIVCSLQIPDPGSANRSVSLRTISSGTDQQTRDIAKAMALITSQHLTHVFAGILKVPGEDDA